MSKRKQRLASALLILFFTAVGIVFLFPLYYLLMASFKPSSDLFRYGLDLRLNFASMSWDNYKLLFTDNKGVYFHWYKNSILITALSTAASLFVSSLVGYGLGAYDFRGRNFIFILVLFVLMVPIEILMLPLYKLTVAMKIINTYS